MVDTQPTTNTETRATVVLVPFLLTLATRTTDEVKEHWPDLILPPDIEPATLAWAWRSVHPDFRSKNNYRWPYPGNWATASGPYHPLNIDPCPAAKGDGICLAHTLYGAGSGGIRLGTGLICAYLEPDVLGHDRDKLRVKRAWVAEVVDTLGQLTGHSADLSGANLSGADLRSAHLYSANLYGANLRGAHLYSANLSGANLRSADLSGANLRSASLCTANLRSANLYGANLRTADLHSANLRSANLSGANLYDVNLRSANLRSANLSGANLSSVDLRGADLRGADLRGVNLYGARYSQGTLFPDGFDPTKAGMVCR